MKDAYTFDRDAEGLDAATSKHIGAYDRIFDRAGLEWYRVESDVGMMGGLGAHEYMAPCAAGENEVALAPGYAANVEIASAEPRRSSCRRRAAPEEVSTPGLTTVDEVARALGRARRRAAQGLPGHGRGPRDGARARAGRPPRERDQAPERARRRLPARPARRSSSSASARPASSARSAPTSDPAGRRGRRRRRLRHRRQPRRHPPARRPARARLRLRARGHPPRRAGRPVDGAPDPDRAGDRGRQHLQARHALLRAAGRHLPRRGRHARS